MEPLAEELIQPNRYSASGGLPLPLVLLIESNFEVTRCLSSRRRVALAVLTIGISFLSALPLAVAAADAKVELVLKGSGEANSVSCALTAKSHANDFPTDHTHAARVNSTTENGRKICVFENVMAGTYAAAAFQDANRNGRNDKDVFGRPTEAWGVSGGARPIFRAPKFDEALFNVGDAETKSIEINLR